MIGKQYELMVSALCNAEFSKVKLEILVKLYFS